MVAHKKYILVTGSSDGIGKEIGIGFVKKGFPVIFHGSNAAKLEKLRAELPEGADFHTWCADLSDVDLVAESLIQLEEFSIGTLVLCAGRIPVTKFKAINYEKFKETLNINFLSQLLLCESLIRTSAIEFVCTLSTLSTIYGFRGYALYASTKALLNSLGDYFVDSGAVFYNLVLGDISKNDDGLILGNSELTAHLNVSYPFGLGKSRDVFNVVYELYQSKEIVKAGTFFLEGGITNKLLI